MKSKIQEFVFVLQYVLQDQEFDHSGIHMHAVCLQINLITVAYTCMQNAYRFAVLAGTQQSTIFPYSERYSARYYAPYWLLPPSDDGIGIIHLDESQERIHRTKFPPPPIKHP